MNEQYFDEDGELLENTDGDSTVERECVTCSCQRFIKIKFLQDYDRECRTCSNETARKENRESQYD
jgi:hypothetical protein